MKHDPGGKSKPPWPEGSKVRAKFSDCERYRYGLSEIWDKDLPLVMFLMMNPSVAGIEHADPTLIRTGRYARTWGYGGQLVGNIHAYRLTDSTLLATAEEPVGPKNDITLLHMAKKAKIVVLAYGLPPKPLRARAATVVEMLAATSKLKYLALTKDGIPKHPGRLARTLVPLDFSPTKLR
jgi:hypothetical protein